MGLLEGEREPLRQLVSDLEFALDDPLARAAQRVIRTSAKTGAGVESAFNTLVDAYLTEERDSAS